MRVCSKGGWTGVLVAVAFLAGLAVGAAASSPPAADPGPYDRVEVWHRYFYKGHFVAQEHIEGEDGAR